MDRQPLDGILPLVQHPSHYLGSEINAIRKDPARVKLRIALAFPDRYEVGMSHVGIQILYHILNAREDVAAERVFTPGNDLEAELRAANMPLCSLETGTPLSHFDIIGFSLLYELNYTNVLSMLDLANIPLYAQDRNDAYPLIIGGGPCTFNPEPLADFFDAMVVGDGEEAVVALVESWLMWKRTGQKGQSLLDIWSEIEGVYVPSFFEVHNDAKGFQVLRPRFPGYTTVHKALVSDLNREPYPDRPVIAFGNPVHDRLSLEICRGCTRGCRFCQAGMIYRPVRERRPDRVLSLADMALANTGYEDISLLSLSAGDYRAIQELMERLMNRCEPDKTAVSLPSLRVGSLTESLMGQIKRVRKTGFTVAPEAGSQRLRNVINKDVTEESILKIVENAFRLGWRLIKLYFMIGLPTETECDLDAIVGLVKRLGKVRVRGGRRGKITVSISTFIPKAHTPFQWCPQVLVGESKEKIHMLKSELQGRGVRFKWQNPEMSILEGLWARGDRQLSRLLVKAYEIGCRFDGWSDRFRYDQWQEAIEVCGVDIDSYTNRARQLWEPLPWDHIDSGVSKEYLKEEWEKALAGVRTPDCRQGECNLCGVCDFETVEPLTFEADPAVKVHTLTSSALEKPLFKRLQVSYTKEGPAKYFGHLELVKILMRAFRRARIPLRYSQGFHPAPKVSFEPALPIGIESTEERFLVQVPLYVKEASIVECVNEQLPEGLSLTRCVRLYGRSSPQPHKTLHYIITLKDVSFSKEKLNEFNEGSTWVMTKTDRKGHARKIDLKRTVTELYLVSHRTIQMTLDMSFGGHVRPTEALSHIFDLPERSLRLADIVKYAVSSLEKNVVANDEHPDAVPSTIIHG